MPALLDFTTSGVMQIRLQGARFGTLKVDPDRNGNVKHFRLDPYVIDLEVHDMNHFSGWGRVEVIDEGGPGAIMTVIINTNAAGWYGTAQFQLHAGNGQHIVSHNFQSGVGIVPGGDPKERKYNIRAL